MDDLKDFTNPVSLTFISEDQGYTDGQLGRHIKLYDEDFPDLDETDVILIGIREYRGNAGEEENNAADVIRKHLYRLHYWHTDVRIADIGNIKTGESLQDSYAAIRTILVELIKAGKTVLLLGGSHDIMLAQYYAYCHLNRTVEATCIDARIDLKGESPVRSENFLMEMLTSEPNQIKHYNHIAFQSYFVHPRMLETLDKLRFDCFRVGTVTEDIEEMEPVLRNTDLLSLDISAIKYSDAPANRECPNGLSGVEACMLTRYAGLSPALSSFGIYNYDPGKDENELTAIQASQLIWYFIDGRQKLLQEASLGDLQYFNEYHTIFTEIETRFLQSKKTQRWWMQMPDKKFIACSYQDYVKASSNEIPERWLRFQERA
ncbi:MAG: formimidoylglutamase [Ferruginibacter sp.]